MAMITVAVGSTSELKLRAVRQALAELDINNFVDGVDVDSGVPDQPRGFREMTQGASARATGALEGVSTAEVGIGIENGLVSIHELGGRDVDSDRRAVLTGANQYFDPPCVAVVSRKHGGPFFSFGLFLPIPHWMEERTRLESSELGIVVQSVAGGGEKDPHKWLSNGTLPRDQVVVHAVMAALLPVLQTERYATQST